MPSSVWHRIDITVIVDGEITMDGWFEDHEEAAQFAVDLMHTCQTR